MKKLPDTPLVKEASQLLRVVLSENIWNHSMRTYHLADAFATQKNISYAQEELALVSLFHDLGLYHPYTLKGKAFQIGSSSALKDFLLETQQVPATKINAMMEAIDFHFQLRPRWDKGTLAGLLQVGAHMDVLGTKRRAVPSEQRKLILATYPKRRFFLEFNRCLLKTFSSPKAVLGILAPQCCHGPHHYCPTNPPS